MCRLLLSGASSVLGRQIKKHVTDYEIITVGRHVDDDIFLDMEGNKVPSVAGIRDIDLAIHCAASFGDDSIGGILNNVSVNVNGTLLFADLCRRLKCKRLIHISSLSAFDCLENEYTSSYGITKRHAEELLSHFAVTEGMDCLSIRLTQLYDEYGHCRKHQPFLYRIVDQVMQNKNIVLWGKADPLRNYMIVSDAARLIWALALSSLKGVVSLTHPESYSITKLCETVISEMNSSAQIVRDFTKQDFKSIYIPSSENIFMALGTHPAVSFSQGIRMMAAQGGKAEL